MAHLPQPLHPPPTDHPPKWSGTKQQQTPARLVSTTPAVHKTHVGTALTRQQYYSDRISMSMRDPVPAVTGVRATRLLQSLQHNSPGDSEVESN